jgi:hypothetical protein
MTIAPASSLGLRPYADDTILPLLMDLLAWLAPGPRPYAEVMETWRTSCPRLPVWEDAVDLGLVAREGGTAESPVVTLTPRGWLALDQRRSD